MATLIAAVSAKIPSCISIIRGTAGLLGLPPLRLCLEPASVKVASWGDMEDMEVLCLLGPAADNEGRVGDATGGSTPCLLLGPEAGEGGPEADGEATGVTCL